jgi:V8-like Glu-specific endopeptidase
MTRHRPLLGPLMLGLAATFSPACTLELPAPATTAGPIVDGTVDAGDPAVVAIGARRVGCGEDLAARCTGTLIAPRLVLTAAHCVIDPRLSSELEVFFGSATDAPGPQIRRVVHVAPHPDYRDDGDDADLAALILDEPAPVAPLPLDPGTLDDAWIGAAVRLVGFGQPSSTELTTGTKRAGTAVITEMDAATFRIEADPAMSCHGDSGGPVLATRDGGEVLIGVTSRGDPGCVVYGQNVRVDSFRASFLAAWIDAAATWPTPPAGDGDTLASLADAICTQPCIDDAACPAGLVCRPSPGPDGIANRCALPGLVAGSFGDACTGDATCNDRCVRLSAGDSPDACRCYQACADAPTTEPGGGCQIGSAAAVGTVGSAKNVGITTLIAFAALTLVCFVMRLRHCPTSTHHPSRRMKASSRLH